MKALMIPVDGAPPNAQPMEITSTDTLGAARKLLPTISTFACVLVEWGNPPRRAHMLVDEDGGPRALPYNLEASILAGIPIVGDVLLLDGLLS